MQDALERPALPRSGPRNIVAFVALGCGLACIVPWVIVLTFPLAIVFGVAGLARSARLGGDGRGAALIGIGVALVAAALQLALAGLAALVGYLF